MVRLSRRRGSHTGGVGTSSNAPVVATTLANGLRIRVAPMPQARSVTVSLGFATGSRYEDSSEQGIAHLVEHMLFKGTARYPTAQVISEAIEGVGGILNAGTEKELTTYWAKVASEHLVLAVDLLADMATAPRIDDDELEKEKKVVIEELGLAQDAPGEWVHQLLSESLWPDQPLGREIAGTPGTVNAQTPASLARYLRRTHGLSNAVLVVAGDADPDQVIALANERLGQHGGPPPTWERAHGNGGTPRVVTETRATEQAYLALAGYGLPRGHADRYALRVLNSILGDGMSSRLFLEVRERRGLTYDIASYLANFHDTGAIAIAAGVEPERTVEAVEAIVGEVSKLRDDPVPDTELRKIKAYLRGRTLLSLEDSSSVASWWSTPVLLGNEERTPDEVLDLIDAVTASDVQRVANELLAPGSFHLAHIGPPIAQDELLGPLLA